MNIVEPILFQARHQPGAPALSAQGHDVISYGRLAAQMNIIARRALSLGLVGGNVVALSLDEPLLHAAFILGLTQVGIIPVSVAGHEPPDGLAVDQALGAWIEAAAGSLGWEAEPLPSRSGCGKRLFTSCLLSFSCPDPGSLLASTGGTTDSSGVVRLRPQHGTRALLPW